MKKPESKCPQCKGVLTWKVVAGSLGKPLYNGLCSKCNIVLKGRETPDLKKGRLLAKKLVGIDCMDKQITQHNGDVQLGILRAKMHCATCGEPSYIIGSQTVETSCKCTDCKCLYCRTN